MFYNVSLFLLFGILISSCSIVPVNHAFILSGDSYSKSNMSDSVIALLNWNVHKESDFPLLQKELITFVEKVNPNYLTLQEFLLTDTIENKLEGLKKVGWEFAPNIYSSKVNAYSGLSTLSDIKPLYKKSYLSNSKEPILGTRKIFLVTKYGIENSNYELMIINIHGINFKLGNKSFKEQMMNLIYVASKHVGPVIVAGDFNTWKKSRLDFLNSQFDKCNFDEVLFQGEEKSVATAFGNKLDHIYYSSNYLKLITGSNQIIHTFQSSDHNALYAEFVLDINK